ncbi:MAG TPA: tetratricopeptide repeat protein [Caldimonas sp.]|nr:tetratricopeptide repeat protein [Caldimonas sp.]HEX4233051.1 tetratricopeptide repeat protein [Caldimonas sp.]
MARAAEELTLAAFAIMRRDPRGLPVSTASAAALAASERALWRMMSFYGTPIDDCDVAIAADPVWPLPRLMKAGFLLSLTEPSLAADARALLAEVPTSGAASGNARERAHRGALDHLAAGDWAGAGAVWSEILREHRHDALALQWAHLFDFYRGDAAQLAGRVAPLIGDWPNDDPLHPCVLALHAFGLEEAGHYAEAETTGRRALDADARVPWAIHAVAHVMEMQGRHDEGSAWMAARRAHWGAREPAADGSGPNGFAGHLGWHEALFALETLALPRALALFDDYLDANRIEVTLQRVDAASLLWRIELVGGEVGPRWQSLLAGWPLGAAAAGHSLFNDAHATMALVGAGELARAREWVAMSLIRTEHDDGWNGTVARAIGAPLLRGLLAFGEREFDRATELLASIHAALGPLGGSRAQRDVIDQTLLAAAARGHDKSVGRALLDQRRRAKPTTPLTAYWSRA